MITKIRRRLGAQGAESGVTLVELMVAIIVFGILSAMVLSFYVASNRSVISTSSTDRNTQAASAVMNELVRVIHGATTNPNTNGAAESPAIISATASTLSLYSYVDSSALTTTPYYVQFTINSSNNLIEKRWPASVDANGIFTFNTSATPTLSRTFPGALTITAPLFSYTDQNGNNLGGTVSSANLTNVASVTATVVAQTSTDPTVKPVTLTNIIGMPNVTLEDNNS